MSHELFITHCTNGTSIMNPFTHVFIDYTKAFNQVKHSKMIECLKEIGVGDTELQIITKLYCEQSAVVRTESE